MKKTIFAGIAGIAISMTGSTHASWLSEATGIHVDLTRPVAVVATTVVGTIVAGPAGAAIGACIGMDATNKDPSKNQGCGQ